MYLVRITAATTKADRGQMNIPVILQPQEANVNMSSEMVTKEKELKHMWDFDASLSPSSSHNFSDSFFPRLTVVLQRHLHIRPPSTREVSCRTLRLI